MAIEFLDNKGLSQLVEECKAKFALIKHTHTASDVGADASGTASTTVANHNTSTSAHADIRNLISGLTTNKVNVSDIIDNLTTDSTTKPLSANQGVVLKSVTDALQNEVNTKAESSDLTTHTENTTIHITSNERLNWNAAKDHADEDHARVDASNVIASESNGYLVINNIDTPVYIHPTGTNPHGTTKADVGLGNVPNVATNNQTPTYTMATSLSDLESGELLTVAFGKISKAINLLIAHLANVSNPHNVTKSQVGLGNVENKSSATIRGELTKENVTNALGYTPPTSDTNNAVVQTNTTSNAEHRILLSSTASDTETTSGTYKSSNLLFNPSTGVLTVTAIRIGNATLQYDSDESALVIIHE